MSQNGYDIYLGHMLMPVTPDSIDIEHDGNNKTVTLMNTGVINILKSPDLEEVSMTVVLPQIRRPYARYVSGFVPASTFINAFQKAMEKKQKLQFLVVRKLPTGGMLWNTNLTVTVEKFTTKDDAEEGTDIKVELKLKRWQKYGLKYVKLKQKTAEGTTTTTATTEDTRDTSTSPEPKEEPKTYTVKKGDCLVKIAKKFYGDGSKWREIYNANKSVIGGNPNLIYPGQTYTIPVLSS